jgi:hypothetical protein
MSEQTSLVIRRSKPNRRYVLARAATGSALLAARAAFPGSVWAATADAPKTTKSLLGFIALTDASPLIIAKEKSFFAKYGMRDVEVMKEASWGTTRDKIGIGLSWLAIVAAEMLIGGVGIGFFIRGAWNSSLDNPRTHLCRARRLLPRPTDHHDRSADPAH